jgi:cytoskeletal protein RodZ
MTTPAEDFRPRGFDSYPLALGDMMRGERATVGKSLIDVQTDLKIGVKYISAIENGDLSVFETKGFIAGYVRSYARYLNLDGDKAYKQFCLETGFDGLKVEVANRETPSQSNREHRILPGVAANDANVSTLNPISLPMAHWYEKISFSAIGSLLILIALVSGLSYGGWRVLQEVQRVQFAPVNETPGVASNISVLSDGGLVEDITPTLDQTASIDTTVGPTLTLDQLYRPQELDLPSVISRDGPIATINPETQGTYAPKVAAIIPVSVELDAPVAVVEQGIPSIDIVATRPAWVRVYLPDNSVLFEKILNVGERYRLPTDLQAPLLKAGNSGAVYLMIGDKTFGPVGANGGVARKVSLVQADIEGVYSEVLNLFSEPLQPPLNVNSDQTAEAILKAIENN